MTADVVLRDGSTLHVRSAQASDLTMLAGLRDALAGRLSDQWLREFTAILPSDGAVIVGEVGGALQAVAGFKRHGDRRDEAEVVLAVAPALQGRGVGTRLLEMLADQARPMGITSFDAWVSPGDRPIIDVFMSSGFDVDRQAEGGVLHLALRLSVTPRYLERSAERAQEAAAASMHAFFEPRAVAVVGANRQPGKIGSEILNNLVAAGFSGPIYPIHPSGGEIAGRTAFPRLTDVPGPVDLAVVVVPAAHVSGVVDDCVAKGVKAIVVISAVFAETGAAGRALEAELGEKVRAAGVRMVGPNCMGLLNADPAVRLNATFSPVYPPAGRVAMSTQSGALGLAILDYARRLDIGISTFVSVGNKADVSSNDLIQYWADDDHTKVILLYLESFGNPRKFSQIARRVPWPRATRSSTRSSGRPA